MKEVAWLEERLRDFLMIDIIKAVMQCLGLGLDSIAASLFVLNWLSWQIVSDDKIQITILILRRGSLSTLITLKSKLDVSSDVQTGF